MPVCDPDAISGPELAAAFENRDAYLYDEVLQFRAINVAIATNAPYNDSSVQRVVLTPIPGALVLDEPSIQIGCETNVALGQWSRADDPASLPHIAYTYALSAECVNPSIRVLSLRKRSGVSKFLVEGSPLREGATHRIEVWQNGSRIEQYDVVAPSTTEQPERVPFAYDVMIDATHLVMGFVAPYMNPYRVEGTYGSTSSSALFEVPAGSYRVIGQGDMRVDVFETGRVNIVEQGIAVPCMPIQVGENRVRSCGPLGGPTGVDFLAHLPDESPDFGVVRIGGERFPLYPL